MCHGSEMWRRDGAGPLLVLGVVGDGESLGIIEFLTSTMSRVSEFELGDSGKRLECYKSSEQSFNNANTTSNGVEEEGDVDRGSRHV
jgi:hypothetical protein